jgi:hypothetical protein
MLIAPTLVPVIAIGAPVGLVLAGVEAALDGVVALPVWANAEKVNVAAPARRTQKSLLFIGSVELLGT